MDVASGQPRPLLAAAVPASAVVLPPLPVPPPPSTLDAFPEEPGPASRASAVMAIDPLTPPSAAVPRSSPYPPGPGDAAPLANPVPWRVAEPAAGRNVNVGPFKVVDNPNELVVVLGRNKHLRTKADVVEAESADPSVCDVQLPTDRDLTIAGRAPGLTRVMVRLEGNSPQPLALLVRVVPDPTGETRPAAIQASQGNVSPQSNIAQQSSVPPQPNISPQSFLSPQPTVPPQPDVCHRWSCE